MTLLRDLAIYCTVQAVVVFTTMFIAGSWDISTLSVEARAWLAAGGWAFGLTAIVWDTIYVKEL
jgi:hypothetical protein